MIARAFAVAALVGAVSAQKPAVPPPWSEAALQTVATLPVQEGGRVKPLAAFAAHTLFAVHGRRDVKLDFDGDGKTDRTLTPIEWLLDVAFHPEAAADYPLFRIENVDVLDAIGIEHRGQRFDFEYLTYRRLLHPGAAKQVPGDVLWQLSQRYSRKDAADQTPVESHIVRTQEGVDAYLTASVFAPLTSPYALQGERLRALFGGKSSISFAELVRGGAALATLVREFADKTEDPALGNALAIAAVLHDVVQHNRIIGLFPPLPADEKRWLTLGDVAEAGMRGTLAREHQELLDQLQAAALPSAESGREQALGAYRDAVAARATARGEFARVELEEYYLRAAWHYRALHWFLLAIIVVGISWIAPRARWLWRLSLAATALPLCFLIADVVLRCVVRQRPPILNLYDTFLFIGSMGVLVAIVTEMITRRRVAIALAPLFGALIVALARQFEVESGDDQMAPLQAVLDTNYYLATHVTAINLGYAAGMLAAKFGTIWLWLTALGVLRDDRAADKAIVRATYGITAFGLVFAVFGTIYGGVWANDSWGRFWGWDPKENGALLICIAQVALIHARMCGWVRDLGFCLGAGLIGIVVAFSWFHVNLLGIGLHSYGFSSATKVALVTYYIVQGSLCALGAVGVLLRRARVAGAAAAGAGVASPP